MVGVVPSREGEVVDTDVCSHCGRSGREIAKGGHDIHCLKFFDEPPVKETNPKDAVGIAKAPMSTVSAPVIAEVGVAMMEGALKYGRHNYRAIGVRASVYYDALQRHILQWWEGEDIDPDSGLNHITKAISTLVVLRDSMIFKNWVDDRPLKPPQGWMTELNAKAKALLKKYPDPKAPYIEVKS